MRNQRTPPSWRQLKGHHFEDKALQFLQKHGLQLLKRNFRCRLGEIDLIMLDNTTLVFTEVRYRRSSQHGAPHATVNYHKQSRIKAAAHFFLLCNPTMARHPCRFDVVGLAGEKPQLVNWITGAFE